MTAAPGPVTRAASPTVRLTGWRATAAWVIALMVFVCFPLGIQATIELAVGPASQGLWLRGAPR